MGRRRQTTTDYDDAERVGPTWDGEGSTTKVSQRRTGDCQGPRRHEPARDVRKEIALDCSDFLDSAQHQRWTPTKKEERRKKETERRGKKEGRRKKKEKNKKKKEERRKKKEER